MVVLVTCKNKEDPILARECSQHYTSIFRRASADTLELVVVCGRNLNSSKLSCMSALPVRKRMIESKMKELECSQDFSHHKSIGFFLSLKGS